MADWPDLGLILALLLGNSAISYWEETQAGNAIAALKAQLTPKATVKRDGTWKVVDAADIVPGGILLVHFHKKIFSVTITRYNTN